MRTLIQVCCGPCFTAVHEEIAGRAGELTAFYFNPNIHPGLEWRRRLLTLRGFCALKDVQIRVGDYGMGRYFQAVGENDRGPARCRACYTLRLTETAERAAAQGYDSFTTTLLISPYQDHEAIVEIARDLAGRYGLRFFYEDWRPLFGRSVELSKAFGLYRQKYCGCIYSEQERFAGRIKDAGRGLAR